MAHNFGPLREQAAEDALHAERLLFIEERPFHRVTRRLLADESTLRNIPRQLPSPPPESAEAEEAPKQPQVQPFSRERFWEDVLIDFAALQSSITRIQLIHSSNERERERYASEKEKILASAQAVRENTVVLRAQLAEAQKVLELRKGYDTLAGKILDDRRLKSRDEAKQDIATLEKEIEDLQAEGSEIESLWAVRKEGFEKVVESGQAFIRAIKGIKDPSEDTGEEMDEGEDGAKVASNIGTPLPDGSTTPSIEIGDATPRPADEEDTQGDHVPSKLSQVDNVSTQDVDMQESQADAADNAETMDES